MRLGATAAYTYAYKGTQMNLDDYLDSISSLGEMGIKYFDLEILQEEHIKIYLSDENIRLLKMMCRKYGVNIVGFTSWVCVKYLHSEDRANQQKCFELFRKICKIASNLGVDYIHMGSDMINEYIVNRDSTYMSAPPVKIAIPENVSLKEIQKVYAENLHQLADIAEKTGLKFSLECRANALVSGADDFMKIYEMVSHKNLYCCLDVMHCAFHKEDISKAVKKLGDKLLVFQLCDSIAGDMTHYPFGAGNVKTREIIKALKKINFKGYLMLEIYKSGKDRKEIVDSWYRDAYSKTHMELMVS